MTTQQLAETQLVDGIPALKLLEGLARLYELVLLLDRERRVIWISNGFDEMFDAGFRVGDDVRRVLPDLPVLPRPEQVFQMRSQLRQQGFLSNARIELHPRGDDRTVPIEVNILPVFPEEEDDSPFFVVIARRVDEPVEAPKRSAAIAAVLEGAPDAVLAVDGRGFVTYANAAIEQLVGYRAVEVIGRPVALLLSHASDLERLVSSLEPGQGQFDQDLSVHHRDGGDVVVSASAGALGHGTVLVLRDVTERRRIEAELEHKNAELEHCVHSLAHDLRSPLVALLGFSRLLRQDYGHQLDATGAHFLDRIEQAGRTMEDLIHDLLELSRIGHGGEPRNLVDPRPILQQIAAELKPRLDAGKVRLVLPSDPPLVYSDHTRLYQVFSNLIGNALDHMGPCRSPVIEVSVEAVDAFHRLGVRDSGRGVPSEHQQRIFDVFQSLGARSDGRRGSGIGLAVVRKIAETHGGRAWVESEDGRGSTFFVTLPRP